MLLRHLEIGIAHTSMQRAHVLIESSDHLVAVVVLINLAPRKHVCAAENVRVAVPAHHEHLGALVSVAQQHHGRGRAGRGLDFLVVQFHQVRAPESVNGRLRPADEPKKGTPRFYRRRLRRARLPQTQT